MNTKQPSLRERKSVVSQIRKLVYQGHMRDLEPVLSQLDFDEYQVFDLAFCQGYKTDVEARGHYPFSIGKWSYVKARMLDKFAAHFQQKTTSKLSA